MSAVRLGEYGPKTCGDLGDAMTSKGPRSFFHPTTEGSGVSFTFYLENKKERKLELLIPDNIEREGSP